MWTYLAGYEPPHLSCGGLSIVAQETGGVVRLFPNKFSQQRKSRKLKVPYTLESWDVK